MQAFIHNFLTSRKLERPDGRDLWQYHMQESEACELQTILKRQIEKQIGNELRTTSARRFWQGYVLYTSYIQTRQWKQGRASYENTNFHLDWKPNGPLHNGIREGLLAWKLKILQTKQTSQYLLSSIYTGGIPPAALREYGQPVSHYIRKGLNLCAKHAEDATPDILLEDTREYRMQNLSASIREPAIALVLDKIIQRLIEAGPSLQGVKSVEEAIDFVDITGVPIHSTQMLRSFMGSLIEQNNDVLKTAFRHFRIDLNLHLSETQAQLTFKRILPSRMLAKDLHLNGAQPLKPMIACLCTGTRQINLAQVRHDHGDVYRLTSLDHGQAPESVLHELKPMRLILRQSGREVGQICNFRQPDYNQPLIFSHTDSMQQRYIGEGSLRTRYKQALVLSAQKMDSPQAQAFQLGTHTVYILRLNEPGSHAIETEDGQQCIVQTGCKNTATIDIGSKPDAILHTLKPNVYTSFPDITADFGTLSFRHETQSALTETLPPLKPSGRYEVVLKCDEGEVLDTKSFVYWPGARHIYCEEREHLLLHCMAGDVQELTIENASFVKQHKSIWVFRCSNPKEVSATFELTSGVKVHLAFPVMRHSGAVEDTHLKRQLMDQEYLARMALEGCQITLGSEADWTVSTLVDEAKVSQDIQSLLQTERQFKQLDQPRTFPLNPRRFFPLHCLTYGERVHQQLSVQGPKGHRRCIIVETDFNLHLNFKDRTLQIKDGCWNQLDDEQKQNFELFGFRIDCDEHWQRLDTMPVSGCFDLKHIFQEGGYWAFWATYHGITRAAFSQVLRLPTATTKAVDPLFQTNPPIDIEDENTLLVFKQTLKALEFVPAMAFSYLEVLLRDPELTTSLITRLLADNENQLQNLIEATPWHPAFLTFEEYLAGIRRQLHQTLHSLDEAGLPEELKHTIINEWCKSVLQPLERQVPGLKAMQDELAKRLSPQYLPEIPFQTDIPAIEETLQNLKLRDLQKVELSEPLTHWIETHYDDIKRCFKDLNADQIPENSLKIVTAAYMTARALLGELPLGKSQREHFKVLIWLAPEEFHDLVNWFCHRLKEER